MSDVPIIRTERFKLRPLIYTDTKALYPTFADDVQCRYLSRPAFESEDALWEWLAEPGWNGRTWIAEDEQGEVAGRFVAVPGHEEGIEEIGYVTCADRQGEGVARECTAALVSHLVQTEGKRKVIAEVDLENVPSIRLLTGLGFTREALFREHETTHKGLCDLAVYGLLASDPLP
ncbi:GNAT family protein [Qipengyuania aestuarii]|uniref:GNAT family N-acetyltransferase n=1 Tax=Qipengyuania aestuarii TaxID=2867241 RepID=UPI0031ED6F3D